LKVALMAPGISIAIKDLIVSSVGSLRVVTLQQSEYLQ
jgi:hypothetical protein